MIHAVVFDLDGVVRYFDPTQVATIEEQYGLAADTLERAAFAPDTLRQVTTGQITKSQWLRQIGHSIGNPAAAQDWGQRRGEVDGHTIEIVRELRAQGYTTAILTNGTDETLGEIESLRVADEFDAFFCSATIGYAKPDTNVFRHVLRQLGLRGEEVFFTDDLATHCSGARELGMYTSLFTSAEKLREDLRSAGIVIRKRPYPMPAHG